MPSRQRTKAPTAPKPSKQSRRLGTGADLETNAKDLVEVAVRGEVSHPIVERHGYDVTRDGLLQSLPGVGGIVYSHFVGDRCTGLAGDHTEPGASVSNFESKWSENQAKSALNVLAQVGNTAIVSSGDAKGCIGTVVGKHGGVEHVVVHFEEEVLDLLDIGDQIRVRATGAGLRLLDPAGIMLKNLDPRLFARLPLRRVRSALEIGVSHVVPAAVMGSGLGADSTNSGDYDIQLSDPETVRRYGLDSLRFGDIVAITDSYDAFGRSYRPGAVSIGIVAHGDSHIAGHGPGITTILAAMNGRLKPVVTPQANVADLLGLSRTSPGDHHAPRLMERHRARLKST